MKPQTKKSSPVFALAKTLALFFGVLILVGIVKDTTSKIEQAGQTEREGAAKIDAALKELEEIRQNGS